jgi:DNA-directed RNA polymerase subunit RPC12/RpoP
MNESVKVICQDCSDEIIDTRNVVQPYDNLDNYAGFRCGKCGRIFTDREDRKV